MGRSGVGARRRVRRGLTNYLSGRVGNWERGILAERVCGTGKKPARLMQAAGPYQCLSICVYPRGSVANTSYQKILDLISGFSPGRARWLSGPLPF